MKCGLKTREEEGTQACQGTCTHLDVAEESCEMGKTEEEKLEGGRQQSDINIVLSPVKRDLHLEPVRFRTD